MDIRNMNFYNFCRNNTRGLNGIEINKATKELVELFETEHEARKKFFPEFVTEKKVKGEIQRVLSFPKDVDKKEIVWNKVATLEPFVDWVRDTKGKLKVENFDMADSYVVACAGMDKKMK
jgi:hypothetical protein